MSLHEDDLVKLLAKVDTSLFASMSGDEVFAIRRSIGVQNVQTGGLRHYCLKIFIAI